MAKKDKESKKDKKADKAEKSEAPSFKFGVSELAEALGIEPASARVQLRNHKVEKAGKSYGWNTKAELDEVVATIKAGRADKGEGKAEGGKKSKKDKKGKKDKKAE